MSTKNGLALFIFINLFFSHYLFAQTNGGLELWTPSGRPPPFDWKYPTGWTTTNATSEFIGAGVTRSTDAHSGTYAAQIRTLNIFGTLTRSQMVLGNCKLDPPKYQVIGYTGGEQLALIPQQVSFFYKLTLGDANEYAVADLLIKRRPVGNPYPDTVYYESVFLEGAAQYTQVTIPIPPAGINIETDSIVLVFSSNDTNEVALNVLFVDGVTIDFATSLDPPPSVADPINVYPNPIRSGNMLMVNYGSEITASTMQIIDASGKVVSTKYNVPCKGGVSGMLTDGLLPGAYSILIDEKYYARFIITN